MRIVIKLNLKSTEVKRIFSIDGTLEQAKYTAKLLLNFTE